MSYFSLTVAHVIAVHHLFKYLKSICSTQGQQSLTQDLVSDPTPIDIISSCC